MKSECCSREENLGAPEEVRQDLTIRVCSVCQRRHFRLKVDPGVIGAKLSPLGKA